MKSGLYSAGTMSCEYLVLTRPQSGAPCIDLVSVVPLERLLWSLPRGWLVTTDQAKECEQAPRRAVIWCGVCFMIKNN